MKSILLPALLLAGAALAQGKPTIVDYTLDVKTPLPAAQQAELQADFRMMLAKNPAILLSTKTQWKASIAALKRTDCDVRDECLQQLATTAGTLYALYASVQLNAAGTEVTATGRVVNQDRLLVRNRLSFVAPKKGSFNDAAREALNKLVYALELERLSATLSGTAQPTPPIASVNPATPNREPSDLVLVVPAFPSEQPKPSSGNPLRTVAWVTGGLGVAAAGVAIGFGVSAAAARALLPSDGRFDETQARAQAGVNRDATVALGTSVGAAALLVTATVMFVASAPPAAPVVSIAPTPGGAQLTLSGAF